MSDKSIEDAKQVAKLRKELAEAKQAGVNESNANQVNRIEEQLRQHGCGSKRICD